MQVRRIEGQAASLRGRGEEPDSVLAAADTGAATQAEERARDRAAQLAART